MPMQENHLVTKHLTIKCCEDVSPALFQTGDEILLYCACCDTTLMKFKRCQNHSDTFDFIKGA